MKTHQWLFHALLRIGGPVRSNPGKHSAGTAYFRSARGILISALVLGLVAAATALTSHGGLDHLSALRVIANPFIY
jgi:hypothetical protein